MPKKKVRKAQKKARNRAANTKKAAKAAKRAQKPRKGAMKAKRNIKEKKPDTTGIYEETTITCPGCGRVTKVIKVSGLDTEGTICQRCAKGEVEIEEMDF